MKPLIIIFSFLCLNLFCTAQKSNGRILQTTEVNKIFDALFKKNNKITFPIIKVYEYAEDNGKYLLALTESVDAIKGKDTNSKNIKAFLFKAEKNGYIKVIEITDKSNPTINEEYSISFFTKYISLEKVGNTTVPIIVYATKAMNNHMDGRIKIIIIFNNKKITIHHQNAVLDGERLTKIDKAFYTLPSAIQNEVKKKITAMEEEKIAIFGDDWENEMKKKKLEIKG